MLVGLNFKYDKSDPLTDFRNFLFVVWEHLHLPNPTPVQYDLASFLQHGEKRIVIEAFRGVGKSWVTSAFVCWLLYMNPQLNILVASASKVRSDDFTTFTMRLIMEMDILAHLIPGKDQRNSKIAFDVAPARASHAPSVKSVGIFGQLAGSRADVIIADDIEIPTNSATQMMRDKLSEAVKEFDAVLKPDGRIIYLGTPQTEMSLYNELPNRGYKVRIWPARYPDEKRQVSYGDKLAPRIFNKLMDGTGVVGEPTDTQRFSATDLLERELSYGRSGFALQFMLDTSLSDAERYPLKVEDLIVMNTNNEVAPERVIWAAAPDLAYNDLQNVAFTGDKFYAPMSISDQWLPYTGSIMAIDPAGRGADELSYAVVKMLNGYLYVTKAGGLQGGYGEDNLTKLARIAKAEKVNAIIIESNFGDGMFTQLLKPVLRKVYPCTTEEVRHSQQKEARIIDTLEPVMNQHRLVVDKRVLINDYESTKDMPPEKALKYQLVYQMTRVTREKGALSHDDRLDVLAMAVAYWVEKMAQDVDEAVMERWQSDVQKEIEQLHAAIDDGRGWCTGHLPDSNSDSNLTWI